MHEKTYDDLTQFVKFIYFPGPALDQEFLQKNYIQAFKQEGLMPSEDEDCPFVVIFAPINAEEQSLADFLSQFQGMQTGYYWMVLYGEEKPTLNQCLDWLSLGIKDVFPGFSAERIALVLKSKIKRAKMIDEIIETPAISESLVGQSPCWKHFLRRLVDGIVFSQANLLLIGETGTGKEQIAKLVHDLDNRLGKRSLVTLDCTTIQPELSGSEFYGHEKGAYTHALSSRDGAFALAHEGTLFLDEIGELPLSMQAGLLRVIQEGAYKRLGSNNWRKTQFRLVCATHRNMEEAVTNGTFRQDLYYRLATWSLRVPPLRDRITDVPVLVQCFLKEYFPRLPEISFDKRVLQLLLSKTYQGNVRELRNLAQRIAHRHTGSGYITIGDVPMEDRNIEPVEHLHTGHGFFDFEKALCMGQDLKRIKEVVAERIIDFVLQQEQGSIQKAAKRLKVSDRTIQLRLAARKVSA